MLCVCLYLIVFVFCNCFCNVLKNKKNKKKTNFIIAKKHAFSHFHWTISSQKKEK